MSWPEIINISPTIQCVAIPMMDIMSGVLSTNKTHNSASNFDRSMCGFDASGVLLILPIMGV
jgi:hypothetical protein